MRNLRQLGVDSASQGFLGEGYPKKGGAKG